MDGEGEAPAPPEDGTSDSNTQAKDESATGDSNDEDKVIGSSFLKPVFIGNLHSDFNSEDVMEIFERPILPDSVKDEMGPVGVERVDMKRGYCFVFLKDVKTQGEKEHAERFVEVINGMSVPRVSDAIRAEFARGDGRVKRKEDERRKNIAPSDTLFVVNFNEATTKREDLQLLFEPFGELVRIDMKRNYAFVQFKTIDEATAAKERTNGGKLDQSILTVEYVARPRLDEMRRDGGGRRDGRDFGRGPRGGGDRYDDSRGGYGRGPPNRGGHAYDRRYDRDRHGYDRDQRRSRSPPGYRRRSRSRSRSPPRYGYRDRERSPPRGRYDDRYDGYGRGGQDHRDRGYR